ncbi:Rieske 2Fe-2S domain-containing protein [Candidatus Woesearchaeota archaeon]|nr:Rieske 2Fe-2S domain-containing protein [Candidatus Woesearchaeota archaeon]
MVKIAKVGDVKGKLCISMKGKSLALFNVKGKFYCIDNTCPHLYGPLCKGPRNGFIVSCPWHGSKFDIRNGSLQGPPARTGVKSYKVTVKGDDILVDL